MKSVPCDLDLDSVLCIANGLDVMLISDDEVLVQFGTHSRPSELLRDSEVKGILGKIAHRLSSGPAKTNELLSLLPPKDVSEARDLLKDLLARGILTEFEKDPVAQYLGYTFGRNCSLNQQKLGVIGAGPLGARFAHVLLQHGVGQLVLLDDRAVDAMWYSFLPLGLLQNGQEDGLAHLVLRDILKASGFPSVEAIDGEVNENAVEKLVVESDLVCVTFEQQHFRLFHLINRICLRHRKPWILATLDGNFAHIGPLFLPFQTACYNDFRTLTVSGNPSSEMTRKYHRFLLQKGVDSFSFGLPAYAEIAAGHLALAVVHFLLRGFCFAIGRVMIVDFDRMLIDVEDVLRLPRCPVCGLERCGYRPPFPPEIIESVAESAEH